MYAEPDDIDRGSLSHALGAYWNISAMSLIYEPVGFGTHHYSTTDSGGMRWWINVDKLAMKEWIATGDEDAAFDGLERTISTAVALHDAGLEFVHAPVPHSSGVLALSQPGYAVSVYRFVDGVSLRQGAYRTSEDRRRVLEMVGRIHAATGHIDSTVPLRDPLEVPLRDSFYGALDDVDTPWTTGPYAERTRELLGTTQTEIRDLFAKLDDLLGHVRPDGWVVTHGEPHPANVMRTTAGALLLIDWDTAAIAPPERDLWMIGATEDELAAYTAAGGAIRIDPDILALFRLRWRLWEITGYIELFRRSHVDDANTRESWESLLYYVEGRED